MIITQTGPGSAFLNELIITEKTEQAEDSWITVIVGENGTKKSLLLRNISDDILSTGRKNNLKVIGEISKIIALSGTPLDRFPRINNGTSKKFSYFGLRASNNVAGTGQSEKSLIIALISNRNRLKNRASKFKFVFGQLDLEPRIKAEFQIARKFMMYFIEAEDNDFSPKRIFDVIEKYATQNSKLLRTNTQAKRDFVTALNFVSTEEGKSDLWQVLRRLVKKNLHVTITTATNYVSKNTFPISIWRVLLETGIIDLRKTWFQPDENSSNWGNGEIPGDYLSSGQWNWLCTLGGLTAEVDDNSAILIDEPENSLHPAWQRDYIPAIISILNGVKGCHVVLATHSPLIASGLPPGSGNIRRLQRETMNGLSTVFSIEAQNTFGWSASDAYEALFELETTRAKIFNTNATVALKMIKEKIGTQEERTEVADGLRKHCDSLPALDPMRHVMERVAISLSKDINQ